ncbi:MAG: DUF418 domain-containing protein [Clostridium sp.]|nr:DUF418 domain-containing protein [Clostridium sp.]
MENPIAAAPKHSRVDVADVLRGLSVLAIILIHSIEHFNFYSFPDTSAQPAWLNFLDRAVWDSTFFMISGKAYAIFALLFGFSFFIQDDNQRMKGNDFRLRFCWRLLILFAIGNINAMFFTGEVLVMYALVGFTLVLTCRLSTKVLLWLAAILAIQPISVFNAIMSVADPGYVAPMINDGPFWSAAFAEQSDGTFLSTAKMNLWEGQLASLAWSWNQGRIFQTASLFIIGMLIGRQGWFKAKYTDNWIKTAFISLIAFFALNGLSSMLPQYIESQGLRFSLNIIVSSLARMAFMFMLVSFVIFFYYRTSLTPALNKIIPYGRLSMTCYVTQSIVGSFLFYNWGLGLYRYLGIAPSILVGVAIFLAQYAFCRWWLTIRSRGPLEDLWCRLTWLPAKA